VVLPPGGSVEHMLAAGPVVGEGLLRHLLLNDDGDFVVDDEGGGEGLLPMYLSQSLCHPRSPFRDVAAWDMAFAAKPDPAPTTTTTATATTTNRRVRNNNNNPSFSHSSSREPEPPPPPPDIVKAWTIRLIYLAMVHHQHRHAYEEAAERYNRHHPHHRNHSHQRRQRGGEAHRAAGPATSSCRSANRTFSTPLQQDHLAAAHKVGPYDYECPNANFLVVGLGPVGLGANVRNGMVEALLAGLASDRVVLFVNNAPVGPKPLTEPWPLASCPRRDYQCAFLPPTPCALTHADLEGAHTLSRSEVRAAIRDGVLPSHPHRVWHMPLSYSSRIMFPRAAAERLHRHAMALLGPILQQGPGASGSSSSSSPPSSLDGRKREVLLWAAREILERNATRRPLYGYRGSYRPIDHALVLFVTRPNPRTAAGLYNYGSSSGGGGGGARGGGAAPSPERTDDIDPDRTVGLPIRGTYAVRRGTTMPRTARGCRQEGCSLSDCIAVVGADNARSPPVPSRFFFLRCTAASDKCLRESECLSFQQHVEATSGLLQRHHSDIIFLRGGALDAGGGGALPTLLVTTESLDVAREFRAFRRNRTAQELALPVRFRLVTNEADVTPDTGYLARTTHERASASASSASSIPSSFTADEAMVSALSTLQHQLLARATVANCCSNFHLLLAELLAAGCGAAIHGGGGGGVGSPSSSPSSSPSPSFSSSSTSFGHTLHCLQEHFDPRYRVCCGWAAKCKERKRWAMIAQNDGGGGGEGGHQQPHEVEAGGRRK
jgi:hypothetical protein